ncbi:DNA-binding GntR family transcriptional regulator [Nakamurella sp. UYEF19]|uniref:GntR family transcriptional regulator n=1 Tax=Nakamurella sp. UYEF19 TaxID=1756392 RepID=UPI003398B25A
MDASGVQVSAAERVYQHVRTGILTRRFADNDLLAEGRIAEEIAVSRTPVREALLRLEAEGMVRLLPKRGALVLPVSAQEWRDVLSTRELVETYCVTQVIDGGRAPMLTTRLEAAVQGVEQAARAKDVAAYVSADRDFHATIVAAAGNNILDRLYSSLRDRQLRMGAANLFAAGGLDDPIRINRTIADHRGIADAIAREDREAAVRLTIEHLATAARSLA